MKKVARNLASAGAVLSLGFAASPAYAWYEIFHTDANGNVVGYTAYCDDNTYLGGWTNGGRATGSYTVYHTGEGC